MLDDAVLHRGRPRHELQNSLDGLLSCYRLESFYHMILSPWTCRLACQSGLLTKQDKHQPTLKPHVERVRRCARCQTKEQSADDRGEDTVMFGVAHGLRSRDGA